ncbi:GCN5-related N-acetyltransferase [Tolypothrix tenuis PCC 7101]|uniref:GCN5-related N-acetyltransferase n=1 Tax=Tolypothrix tenuis PCC 7101 TaxID=231146 RepID=A0A1Z4N8H3_9CYAN|nr:GNAT family N-acetyltransferase [Aulosira sp. FACHB-113]BAZ02029.1 GCN5-related N-acetyltransferase [Tolypothrix tenuis PCC 7101]BAZ74048.1 GCN5-related N-acetyltransferase [Aulosira laxa NIES-50]
MPTIRTLQPGDEMLLENFLLQHIDTSMFLRSNWREAGLVDGGEMFQGTYIAALLDNNIVAVAAHYWNGMVVVQAPVYLPEVVQTAVTQSHRAISGIAGPAAQVEVTKQVLGLANHPTNIDERELLFSLALSDLQIPPALASGEVKCRLPHQEEFDLLAEWYVAYDLETLKKSETPDLYTTARQEIAAHQANATHWVLIVEDKPVAYSTFNARLPDIVQIGGVWTPPALRGKGYARSVVAGSLLEARSQGVERAILFTQQTNLAAQAAYRSIGFRTTGEEFGLVLFEMP